RRGNGGVVGEWGSGGCLCDRLGRQPHRVVQNGLARAPRLSGNQLPRADAALRKAHHPCGDLGATDIDAKRVEWCSLHGLFAEGRSEERRVGKEWRAVGWKGGE